MKAQSTIKNNTTMTTECFATHLLLYLLLLILLMNHSCLSLHQSHACERKTQGTETKRQREMDGEGVMDEKSKSCLVWVEGCWVRECLSCGVSSVPVCPADVPLCCASDCPFQRFHLQENISETGSHALVCAICYRLNSPRGCCSPKFWPFHCHYVFISLKNRYTCTNALGKKTLGTHRDVHAWWVCVRLCLRVTSHSQWTCSLQQSVQVSDNSSCSTHTHTHIYMTKALSYLLESIFIGSENAD